MAFVDEKVTSSHNTKQAKNIILFIGDGMGISTVCK
jgi:alkaline phosphatase